MPTLEERIASLEGRMTPDLRDEMQRGFAETRQDFAGLRQETHHGFAEVREDMGRLRQEMTRGFERLDDRVHHQFLWLISIQVTTMITVIGALAAAFFRTR